jgi:signal transduction histidine kinase/ActR/RegA family two-component response regulator
LTISKRPRGLEFLDGEGPSRAALFAFDWSTSPLGAPETWPSSLRTTLGILFGSRHPMFLWWGPELIQFYNDAYLPSFGSGRHPHAMGQRGRECWDEIWSIIGPQIDDVMSRALASWNEDQLVPILRNGRLEEVYWTYGYSPVLDEQGAVGGTLVVCTETTTRVLAERRLRLLATLAEATSRATDRGALTAAASEVLRDARSDVPFVAIFERGARSAELVLARDENLKSDAARAAVGAALHAWQSRQGGELAPELVSLELAEADTSGPWPEPLREALITPVLDSSGHLPFAVLLFGISPRLGFDASYKNFLGQVAEHLRLEYARVEALRARAEYESQRDNLLLRAPVAVALVTGPDHVFQLANPRFLHMVQRHQIVGKAVRDVFPALVEAPLLRELDRVYSSGEPFVASEYAVTLDLTPGEATEERYFNFNLEPLRGNDQLVYGIMAVALEVTENVRVRRVLERAHGEREKLLTELESANRAKDEFLAMLGHELRNPLSPIVTALELMKLKPGRDTSDERKIIERQVRHLVRLVDDLLDVAKITRGKVELKKESVEVSDVLDKAIEIASHLFEQRRHRLTIDVPKQGLLWTGDPVRLAQSVANLLTNAARYTNPGGHVQLSAAREADELVIRVVDDGVGISADMLPHVFDLFVQGKRSSDRAEGGLGIGLALVKNLVSLHGGFVTAYSAGIGRGSEFVIHLPLLEPGRQSEPPRGMNLSQLASVRRRVLVVDDNQDSAELLRTMLRMAGHDVTIAHDPLAALALAARFAPEIAVLDIGLPVMDGYELAARLRQLPETAKCKLVAVTGYGQSEDRSRSERAGFATHLVKPIDIERLLQILQEPLEPGAA